ncbi:hypothetical protein OLOG_00001 [Ostreococcus lucimarinus virus OlV4]|nr:hypothetical protein OLOG_00001 [Ostreococcus lucimarinus virus OlV4]
MEVDTLFCLAELLLKSFLFRLVPPFFKRLYSSLNSRKNVFLFFMFDALLIISSNIALDRIFKILSLSSLFLRFSFS